MVVHLSTVSWGPQFLVPTISIKKYCGCVVLRENLDDELLKRELASLHISGYPMGVTNAWYIRKKGNQTWIKVGESSNRQMDFAVRFESEDFENGDYQVLGFMSVRVRTEDRDIVVSRQNIADLDIRN
jgi:hypothetical protein